MKLEDVEQTADIHRPATEADDGVAIRTAPDHGVVYKTVPEVAARYRTSPSTVYGWLHKGVAPPSIRVGKRRLFALSDLVAWDAEHAS